MIYCQLKYSIPEQSTINHIEGNDMSVFREIEEWFSTQPQWLQEAARLIIDTGEISCDEETYLLNLCKSEASGETISTCGITPGSITTNESDSNFCLEAIREVKGVNAIRQSQPLAFDSAQMNIVYGGNGTGKTGYIRLLKKASNSRFSEDILKNIYSKEKEKSQTCEILIKTNSGSQVIPCDLADINSSILNGIDVFDSQAALAYLKDGLTATYEPWIIGLLQRLVIVADRLRDLISAEMQSLDIPTIEIPEELQGSIKISALDTITKDTNANIFALQNIEQSSARIKEIEVQLSNSFVVKRDAILRSTKDLQSAISPIKEVQEGLSAPVISSINAAYEDWSVAHKIREESELAFSTEHADVCLSNDTWRAMWDAVGKYSQMQTPDMDIFPYLGDDAICPFCVQPLQKNAKDRLKAIADHVNSNLAQEEKDALKKYLEVLSKIPTMISDRELKILLENLECFTSDEKEDFLNQWQQLSRLLDEAKRKPKLLQLCAFESHLKKLDEANSKYDAELKKINESLDEETRGLLIKEMLELKGEVFLSKCIPAITHLVDVLNRKETLEKAMKLVATTKLTRKNNELASELVTDEYINRFNEELSALSTEGLKAELRQQKSGKGRIPFKVTLISQDNEVVDHLHVLSEGEQRVVALAVFLADATGGTGGRPIVFDDPISSLDHIYERKIAKRLTDLSKERQVIIFTHRLSFFVMIQNITDELGIKPNATCLNNWPGTGFKGNPTSDNSFILDPKGALNKLRNDRISKLKKLEQEGSEEYRETALSICRQIRVCVERCVEKYLFNEVVVRFRSDIQTQKMRKLKFITSEDFDFIDEYMTKYSAFVHSIAEETPQPIPTAAALEADIVRAVDWITGINKRLN